MALIRAQPIFGALAPQFRSVFNLLDEPFGRFAVERQPAVDVSETDKSYKVSVELPGFSREDVKVELAGQDGRTLVISANRKTETKVDTDASGEKSEQSTRWLSEIYRQSFTRSFRLQHAIKQEEIKATLAEGVLQLDLPKAEIAAPHAISIE